MLIGGVFFTMILVSSNWSPFFEAEDGYRNGVVITIVLVILPFVFGEIIYKIYWFLIIAGILTWTGWVVYQVALRM
jgi:hypothetical protein